MRQGPADSKRVTTGGSQKNLPLHFRAVGYRMYLYMVSHGRPSLSRLNPATGKCIKEGSYARGFRRILCLSIAADGKFTSRAKRKMERCWNAEASGKYSGVNDLGEENSRGHLPNLAVDDST